MNRMLGVHGASDPSNRQEVSPGLPDILNLLRLSSAETDLASDLSRAFEICEFQLGDQLANYNVPEPSGISAHIEQNQNDFYLVCTGRVRLLAPDSAGEREVSAQVLEAGETFGGDNLLCHVSLPYRAIAASDCQVARIPTAKLQPWLKQLRLLRDNLHQQVNQRQCLIFFKTSTDLRRLPSHQLRQLLPYLEETEIPAGEALTQVSSSGRFWLRKGKIYNGGQEANLSAALGESWGYPNPAPADWIAGTDLLVYKLSKEHWEAAGAIAPNHFAASGDLASRNGQGRSQIKKTARKSPPLNPAVNRQPETPNPKSSNPETASQSEIAFPKPATHQRVFWQGYPFIRQQSAADCGATCLVMICQYWGKRYSLNYLRNLAGIGRSGASLKALATAAEKLGFQARPVRASFNRLVEQTKPWIAHWQGDHYVVVYQTKGRRILIADPAFGKRSLSHAEFQASWTGYALLLDPTEQFPTVEPKASSVRFWSVIWPYKTLVWQILLASLLLQVFGLVTPLFTQIILDQVVVHKSLSTLPVFALGLLLFGVWRVGLGAIRQYLLFYLANRLDLTLISGFISHTLMLPLKFFETRHVGDIITRVQENQKIQMFLTRQAMTAVLDAAMAVVYVGLMAYYNWQLTLLVLSMIPPIAILTVFANPFLRRVSREIFNEEAAQNSSLVEMMTGVATVKAAAAERDLRWRWEERLTSTINARFRGQKLANNLQATSGLINTLGTTALLWYGAMLVIQDQLTIGEF
ncbi:MAG TPA: peptidase domain-containing ABC transporter, partial [Candidatus Obscuribacterales bacterium]